MFKYLLVLSSLIFSVCKAEAITTYCFVVSHQKVNVLGNEQPFGEIVAESKNIKFPYFKNQSCKWVKTYEELKGEAIKIPDNEQIFVAHYGHGIPGGNCVDVVNGDTIETATAEQVMSAIESIVEHHQLAYVSTIGPA